MLTPEQLAALIKLVSKHESNIDVVLGVINDFACLIEAHLERCSRTGCNHAATVMHVDVKCKMCDACAARGVVNASRNITTDHNDKVNILRTRIANDDCWIDLEDAVRIRKLQGYVEILKRNDVITKHDDFDRFH